MFNVVISGKMGETGRNQQQRRGNLPACKVESGWKNLRCIAFAGKVKSRSGVPGGCDDNEAFTIES